MKKLYIIAGDDIVYKSIANKINKASIPESFESIQAESIEAFATTYNESFKNSNEEMVIVSLKEQENEVENEILREFCEKENLIIINLTNSWNELFERIRSGLDELKKREDVIVEEKKSSSNDGPIIIYTQEKSVEAKEIKAEAEKRITELTKKITALESETKALEEVKKGKNVDLPFFKEKAALPPEIQKKKNHIIGIIGAFPGAGATSLCVNYSDFLIEIGKKVLLLDRTVNKQLTNIEIKGIDRKSCPLYEIDIQEYDSIIIDFGTLAEITCDGTINPKPDMANEKRMERKFCHEIILVASNLPWRLFELKAYIEDEIFADLTKEWLFYLNGQAHSQFEDTRKAYEKKRSLFLPYKFENPYHELNEILNWRS